jgi:hypothetical protein
MFECFLTQKKVMSQKVFLLREVLSALGQAFSLRKQPSNLAEYISNGKKNIRV